MTPSFNFCGPIRRGIWIAGEPVRTIGRLLLGSTSSQGSQMHRPTLLVVEVNETQQQVIRELCERFDYDAHVVSTAEAALDALGCTSFAAIIMDVALPGMDGLACAREVRRRERGTGKHVPIVALTADQTESERSIRSGMDDFLKKPFQPEDFRRMLLRWAYQPRLPNLKILRPLEIQKLKRKPSKPGL